MPRFESKLLCSKKRRAGVRHATRVRGWKDATVPTTQRAKYGCGTWAKMGGTRKVHGDGMTLNPNVSIGKDKETGNPLYPTKFHRAGDLYAGRCQDGDVCPKNAD